MKISIVTDSFKPRVGGIESFLEDFTRILSRNHEVYVLTSAGSMSNNSKQVKHIVREDGVVVIRLPRSYLDYRGVTFNPRALTLVAKTLKLIDPDVIHGHSLYSTLAIMGTYVSWKYLEKPTVLTAHSFLDRDTPPYVILGMRLALRNLGILTAVSRALAIELYNRLKPARLAVTYNCIICNEWQDSSVEKTLEGDPVVVSVLRLTHRKNPLALIHLAEEMAKEAPKARLYIVGDGDLRRVMEKKIMRKGLKNVVFMGVLDRTRIAKVLRESQLFVLPSRTEAFGLSALEAMASGTPVVAMRVGGLPEVVAHGESGLLARDTREFIEYALTLIRDENLRRKLAQGALNRARYFDCENQIRRYMAVYRVAERVMDEKR